MRQCRLIRKLLLRTPPDPTSFKPRDLFELLYMGKEVMNLGEDVIYDTMRFYTMSISDFLDEYFESPLVKASHAGSGIIGSALGVMSPGTAYVLLHHAMGAVDGSMGSWGYARGGMGAIAQAMNDCFIDHGGKTITGSGVEQIIVKNGKVTGVAMEDGNEYYSDVVVSNMTFPRTFLECMDAKDLKPEFLKKVKNFKIRGSSGKVNIALDGLPDFVALRGNPELVRGDMNLIDSMGRLERAYDDWKNGTWSQDPYCDTMIPSLIDPTMAPPGKHFMSVFVQYVPPKVHGKDWTDEQVAQFGHIFQGELTMDQLAFNRPIPGYAQYRGPVKGLYMCGSSNPPGGGVMAAPGANAAREILGDLRKPNTVSRGYGPQSSPSSSHAWPAPSSTILVQYER